MIMKKFISFLLASALILLPITAVCGSMRVCAEGAVSVGRTAVSSKADSRVTASYTYVSADSDGKLLLPSGEPVADAVPTKSGDVPRPPKNDDESDNAETGEAEPETDPRDEIFSWIWDSNSGCLELELPADAFADGFPAGLSFGVKFVGSLKGNFPPVYLTAALTVVTSAGEYVFRAPIEAGGPAVFSADTGIIPPDDEAESVKLSFSCSCSPDELPDNFLLLKIYVTLPFADPDADFSAQRALGLPSIAVLEGAAEQKDGKLILYPGDNGAESADNGDGSTAPPAQNGTCRILVSSVGDKASDPIGYGMSGEDSGGDDGEPTVAYCSINCTAERGGSVKTGDSSVNISSSGVSSLLLRFKYSASVAGVPITVSSAAPVTVEGVRFYMTDLTDSSYIASLSSIVVSDGELRAEGGLSEGSLRLVEKCRLHLYAVSFSGGGPVLLDTVKAASRFAFSASLGSLARRIGECYFYVAADDGENETLITRPRFADPGSAASSGSAEKTGLFGCTSVGVYESGSPNVTVNVYLDRLMGVGTSGTAISHGGTTYTLNNSYVASLDRDMKLYQAAGVAVALRLTLLSSVIGSDGSLLTYGRGGRYTLRADLNGGSDMLLAAVEFLCERYRNVRSLILFSGLNSVYESSGVSAWKVAENAGLLLRLAYGVASTYIPGIYVTLPFDSAPSYSGGSAGENIYYSDEVCGALTALVSEKLSSVGEMTWAVMVTSPDTSEKMLENLLSAGRGSGRSSPSFGVFMWVPDVSEAEDGIENTAQKYAELCAASPASVRIVTLSLEKLAARGLAADDFAVLEKVMKAEEVTVDEWNARVADDFDLLGMAGSCDMWSFRDSYSAGGWFDGGGLEYFGTSGVTDGGNLTGERVLRCVLENSGRGAAGVVLNSFDSTVDLSSSPYVEFELSVKDAEGNNADAELIFVFHSDSGHRAEFKVESTMDAADESGLCRLVCDLSDCSYAGEISSLGIVMYTDGGEIVDLVRVSAYSDSLSGDELSDVIFRQSEENSVPQPTERVIAAVLVSVVTLFITVGVTVRLGRRESEEKEKRRQGLRTS